MKKPYAIIIMDGYGINPSEVGNAIIADGSKYVNELKNNYPSSQLGASGMSVGLPDGQMGNSEVGHLNIGAGRIVYQDLTKITKDIRSGEFFKNAELLRAMHAAKENGKKLHLYGLVSTGGVHSHTEHLYALVEMAKREGLENVYIHAFTDGRDVAPTSGADFLKGGILHFDADSGLFAQLFAIVSTPFFMAQFVQTKTRPAHEIYGV